jgi:carboxyl-terminal processing protease
VIYYRDPNRGVIYEGPLALLVNGQTASASEMMAASLQDYHRAVIIGSTTFGKATVQQFYPLDTTYKPGKQPPPQSKEIMKITFGKFYRLDGQSAQLKGVKPDVELPDAFDELDIGEKFLPNVLSSDTVKRNTLYKPFSILPLGELASRSTKRVVANNDFQNIIKIVEARSNRGLTKTETISLKWQNFEKWIRQRELDLEIIEGDASGKDNKLTVDNNQHDKQWIESNDYEKEINKKWRENIADDIYIREAFLVLCDLINLQRPSSKN